MSNILQTQFANKQQALNDNLEEMLLLEEINNDSVNRDRQEIINHSLLLTRRKSAMNELMDVNNALILKKYLKYKSKYLSLKNKLN